MISVIESFITGLLPDDVSALSDARSRPGVEAGRKLGARSIKPFEGGRWRLRWMRAYGWTRSKRLWELNRFSSAVY